MKSITESLAALGCGKLVEFSEFCAMSAADECAPGWSHGVRELADRAYEVHSAAVHGAPMPRYFVDGWSDPSSGEYRVYSPEDVRYAVSRYARRTALEWLRGRRGRSARDIVRVARASLLVLGAGGGR
jgi:hypothetical protein